MSNVYIINSERSSIHWKYFDVKNHTVLDIGCGRWGLHELIETSPMFFKLNGANKIIGVDAELIEIEFFRNNYKYQDNSEFLNIAINNTEDIRNLIKNYTPTALKIDIEGYEVNMYDLLKEDFDNIKEMAIEYHNLDIYNKMIKKCEEWNFNIHCFAKFEQNMNAGVIFTRKISL